MCNANWSFPADMMYNLIKIYTLLFNSYEHFNKLYMDVLTLGRLGTLLFWSTVVHLV